MLDYQKLLEFLDEYIAHYRELLKFETNKLQMIASDNIDALNKSISKEQAFIMKTNALETKRFVVMTADNKNKSFNEIIAESPKEIKAVLETKHKELSKIIFQIKKVNDNAQEIVSKRLAIISNVNKEVSSDTYTKKGAINHQTQSTMTLNKDI